MSVDHETLQRIRELLQGQRTASLGTLSNQGLPYVSMVPYAIDAANGRMVIHISELGAHTRYLLQRPDASLMICRSETAHDPVHDLPRVTFGMRAHALPRESAEREHACKVYLQRYPDVAFMTEFRDFHFFSLEPVRVRHIGGFGAARTLKPDDALTLLRHA